MLRQQVERCGRICPLCGFAVAHCGDGMGEGGSLELCSVMPNSRFARNQLCQGGREGIDVGSGAALSAKRFRGHVAQRARDRCRLPTGCEVEVNELGEGMGFSRNENIAGLDVAVDDATRVQCSERRGNLCADQSHLLRFAIFGPQVCGLPVAELFDEERGVCWDTRDAVCGREPMQGKRSRQVRVAQWEEEAKLATEQICGDNIVAHLEGNSSVVEPTVLGSKDHGSGAATHCGGDVISSCDQVSHAVGTVQLLGRPSRRVYPSECRRLEHPPMHEDGYVIESLTAAPTIP